jgi:hypothetical protein
MIVQLRNRMRPVCVLVMALKFHQPDQGGFFGGGML